VRPTSKKLLALSAALTLGLAACGGDDVQPAVSGEAAAVEETTTTTTEAPSATASDASSDDPAATLRATMTSLLQEHAYLAGFALETAIDAGPDDPATEAALDALDENTVALGDAVATIPGVDDPGDFVELWRSHIGYFVDYTVGRAAGDDRAVDAALADLEQYQQDAADFFEEITGGELVSDELFGELEAHATMVTTLVDTLLGEGEAETGPFQQLRDAADQMVATADALTTGIVAAHDDVFAGEPGSVPSETRAGLTASLQEHSYLTLLATRQMAEHGGRSAAEAQDAVSLVQSSGEGLANVVAGAIGNAARSSFLGAWRAHSDALLAYAEAATSGGDTAAARGQVDAASGAVSSLLSSALNGADVSADVQAHVDAMVAAIDAIAAGDPAAASLSRAAAQVAPRLATALAPALTAVSEAQDAAEGQGSEGGETGTGSEGSGATPDASSGEGGSSTGGAAEGGATGEGEGSPTEDTEPPGSPAEAGGDAAEGEQG